MTTEKDPTQVANPEALLADLQDLQRRAHRYEIAFYRAGDIRGALLALKEGREIRERIAELEPRPLIEEQFEAVWGKRSPAGMPR